MPNLLERAKLFVSAARSALRILPLAAVLLPADAAVVLNTASDASGSCGGVGSASFTSASGALAISSLPEANGVAGVKMVGLCDYYFGSNTSQPDNYVEISMVVSGSGSFAPDSSLLVSFNFSVETPFGPASGSQFDFLIVAGISGSVAGGFGSYSGSATANSPVSGSFLMSGIEGTVSYTSALLRVYNPNDASLRVNLGTDSIDITAPDPASDVPEPGTALLLAGPVLILLWLRSRRKESPIHEG